MADTASAPTTKTAPPLPATSPTQPRYLRLRQAGFVLWAIGYVPLYAALYSYLQVPPIHRSLIGTGVFLASALAAWWLLGREKHPMLRAWRIFFVTWALLSLPVLLATAEGVASEGWPRGRHNRYIAQLLVLDLTVTVPAFLTALCALIRTHRVTSVLALATGLAYLGNGIFLIKATAKSGGWWFRVNSVLDIVLSGAKMGSYLSIPVGLVLIIGAIMTFRAATALPALPGRRSKTAKGRGSPR